MIVFGPVPSRRLGRSLGINNIPFKRCSYSCIYCQLGRTPIISVNREAFYEPRLILGEVEERINTIEREVDYITFVPDGEPTLDINLGKSISLLKPLGFKIAVITNSSLIWREDVKRDLRLVDLISFKIDTVDKRIWRRINRPHPSLKLGDILDALPDFIRNFDGIVYTETMLVSRVNDGFDNLKGLAEFISHLGVDKSFISIPIRPPAEKTVYPPTKDIIDEAYHLFIDEGVDVEYLTSYENDDEFILPGDIRMEILSVTSVHPIREDTLRKLVEERNIDWGIVEKLVDEEEIIEVVYRGKKFYIRNPSKVK